MDIQNLIYGIKHDDKGGFYIIKTMKKKIKGKNKIIKKKIYLSKSIINKLSKLLDKKEKKTGENIININIGNLNKPKRRRKYIRKSILKQESINKPYSSIVRETFKQPDYQDKKLVIRPIISKFNDIIQQQQHDNLTKKINEIEKQLIEEQKKHNFIEEYDNDEPKIEEIDTTPLITYLKPENEEIIKTQSKDEIERNITKLQLLKNLTKIRVQCNYIKNGRRCNNTSQLYYIMKNTSNFSIITCPYCYKKHRIIYFNLIYDIDDQIKLNQLIINERGLEKGKLDIDDIESLNEDEINDMIENYGYYENKAVDNFNNLIKQHIDFIDDDDDDDDEKKKKKKKKRKKRI